MMKLMSNDKVDKSKLNNNEIDKNLKKIKTPEEKEKNQYSEEEVD